MDFATQQAPAQYLPLAAGLSIWVVVPAKRARLNRARASRDPVIHGRRECANRLDYWIPALSRRAKPASLGRNDRQGCCGTTRSPVVRATCDKGGREQAECAA